MPRSMFLHSDKYSMQMAAYSKLISGTVLLAYNDLGLGPQQNQGFGDEIAFEIIQFESQLAKVGTLNKV